MVRKLNKLSIVFIDIILINIAYFLAIYIKLEGVVDSQLVSYLSRYLHNALYVTVIKLGIFYYFNMYKTIWRYASKVELYNIITAILFSNAMVLSFLFIKQDDLSRTIYILTTLIDLSIIGGFRFILRDYHRSIGIKIRQKYKLKRVMIIGAGDTGKKIIRECKGNNQFGYEPVAIIDDDIKKQGEIIDEIPVVGGRQSILSAVDNYHIDKIIIAIPSASKGEIRDIIDICKETKCRLKILPFRFQSIDGNFDMENIRDIEEGGLGTRAEIRINIDKISPYITGKNVMVTIGGGSIGLEFFRQIGEVGPEKLIILNTYPNLSYRIEGKLKKIYPNLNLKVINCSLTDRYKIEEVFSMEKPNLVFHIEDDYTSLMELSPKKAINNTVFATLNLVQTADIHMVDKFVMISAGKIVSSINIIDESKRICEMIIQSINQNSNTDYKLVKVLNIENSHNYNQDIFPIEYKFLLKFLEELKRLINEGNEEDVINYVKHIVPTYRESDRIKRIEKDKYA